MLSRYHLNLYDFLFYLLFSRCKNHS